MHFRAVLAWAVLLSLFSFAPGAEPAGGKSIIRERQAKQKWALLVGVNSYVNVRSLDFCVADIAAFRQQLVALGFPQEHVFLLTDEAKELKEKPLATNIERQLDVLLGTLDDAGKRVTAPGLVEQGDLVVVAFSGHGVHLDGTSYLCPADASLKKPKSLISVEHVYKQLELCGAEVKLLMVDACRDDPRPGGDKDFQNRADTKAFTSAFDSPPKGILVLASCAPGQKSWEDDQFKHGVFFNYVIEGLGGAADAENGNRNDKVSLLELYAYAQEKTKLRVASTKGAAQTPRLRGEIEGDWEFGSALRRLKPGDVIENSIGMKLAYIPPGEFDMGSPANEEHHQADETLHRVKLTQGFYLGTTEVTQGQWKAVMETEPWKGESFVKEGATYPATYVSWDDAREFVKKLSSKEGKIYRLPTEAEWEYACRAGSQTAYSFGNDASRLTDYAWVSKNAYNRDEFYAHEVGQKKANAFGLHDMHGNVWEWCSDWFHEKYDVGIAIDPSGPSSGSERVVRGGSWDFAPAFARAADRSRSTVVYRDYYYGFRVVRSAMTP